MSNPIEKAIEDAKAALPNIVPDPPGLKTESSPHDLKSRLEWGEPALTIIDVRPRDVFNQGRILGAMEFPLDKLVDLAKNNLETERDIYVYGATDQETAQAVSQLQQAGYKNVAGIKGGLEAWKAIAGPTEGIDETREDPGSNAYNVVSNVKNHLEKQNVDPK